MRDDGKEAGKNRRQRNRVFGTFERRRRGGGGRGRGGRNEKFRFAMKPREIRECTYYEKWRRGRIARHANRALLSTEGGGRRREEGRRGGWPTVRRCVYICRSRDE